MIIIITLIYCNSTVFAFVVLSRICRISFHSSLSNSGHISDALDRKRMSSFDFSDLFYFSYPNQLHDGTFYHSFSAFIIYARMNTHYRHMQLLGQARYHFIHHMGRVRAI